MIASVPDSEKAGKLVALVDALETEQLVERPLGVLIGDIHDRAKLHSLVLSHAFDSRQRTRLASARSPGTAGRPAADKPADQAALDPLGPRPTPGLGGRPG